MTDDVLLTLSLLLMGALLARFIASLIRIPEILVLVAFGAAFGPFALDVVDVPFDSLGAQLMFTLGVSLILFYGGLSPVAADPPARLGDAGPARGSRNGANGSGGGGHGPFRVRPAVGHVACSSAPCCRPRIPRS